MSLILSYAMSLKIIIMVSIPSSNFRHSSSPHGTNSRHEKVDISSPFTRSWYRFLIHNPSKVEFIHECFYQQSMCPTWKNRTLYIRVWISLLLTQDFIEVRDLDDPDKGCEIPYFEEAYWSSNSCFMVPSFSMRETDRHGFFRFFSFSFLLFFSMSLDLVVYFFTNKKIVYFFQNLFVGVIKLGDFFYFS